MDSIIVTTPSFCKYNKEPLSILQQKGYNVIFDYGFKELSHMDQEKRASIKGIVVGLEKINHDILEQMPNVEIVIKHGAGMDNIDSKATDERNIKTFNVPGANAIAVAEATIGLMLNVSRLICVANNSVREGRWERFYGVELFGKTLSIIGLGAIGREVAKRALGFGMDIIAYDIVKTEVEGVKFVELGEAIEKGDYIVLHLPLLESTHHIIDSDMISKMKKKAYLFNTARGGLIDEAALLEALREHRISGAALDVHENEPSVNSEFYRLDNVILTPHLAGFTEEATDKISLACMNYILENIN